MALLPITLIGDKILKKKGRKVTHIDNSTIELIRNMFDTMRNANGIGLAANQVGSDKSIFVIDVSVLEDYKNTKPMALINPEIVWFSDEKITLEEGCLSIPDIRVELERPKKIRIKYQDSDLKTHEIEADELLARVMQHEYDHLVGILFTDRIDDSTKKRLKKSISKIRSRKIETDYPVTDDSEYVLA